MKIMGLALQEHTVGCVIWNTAKEICETSQVFTYPELGIGAMHDLITDCDIILTDEIAPMRATLLQASLPTELVSKHMLQQVPKPNLSLLSPAEDHATHLILAYLKGKGNTMLEQKNLMDTVAMTCLSRGIAEQIVFKNDLWGNQESEYDFLGWIARGTLEHVSFPSYLLRNKVTGQFILANIGHFNEKIVPQIFIV